MKIHEFEAKSILRKYGIPLPEGVVCHTPDEVRIFAESVGAPVVVKAQVHVGGRGKAGGIRLSKTPCDAEEAAKIILRMTIKGLKVQCVLVERALDIRSEYYVGVTVDRSKRRNVLILSKSGGIDIEEVAASTPHLISRVWIDPDIGLADFRVRQSCFEGAIPPDQIGQVGQILHSLYRVFIENDASLAEINPLCVCHDGSIIAADAKIDFDDNAMFRHKDLLEFASDEADDPIEAEAHRRGVEYVRLNGDIGIIGNGAGLVMATLDEVTRAGGKPANFLDIGGGARAEQVANALEIIMMDSKVKGVLFNVFGGITRCDDVAKGILQAVESLKLSVPIVARLCGTQCDAGRELLQNSTLFPAATMSEAAQRIVELTSTDVEEVGNRPCS